MTDTGSDFESMFNESVTEVENGGGESGESRKQNAKIHKGDGEVDDPQLILNAEDDKDWVGGEDEGDDEDGESDESESDDEDAPSEDEDDTDTPAEFDLASHKDELVTVKVNGEELSVPLGELAAGYMRQADYTRKTQQVAELKAAADWGKQMRDALLEDPQGVINGLAASFGLSGVTTEDAETYPDDPELAPIVSELQSTKAELREVKQFMEQQRLAAVDQTVKAEVKAMAEKYDDWADVSKEVLQIVIDRGGQMEIEEAYFIHRGRSGRTAPKVNPAKAAKVAEGEAKKRNLKKPVTTGKRNAEESGPSLKGDSFADMLEQGLASVK
jgi:hypothetical protein